MESLSKQTLCALIIIASLLVPLSTAETSVYVLDHFNDFLTVFKISDSALVYQFQIILPPHGLGPTDIAIDDSAKVLFISYERRDATGTGGNIIETYSATTLTQPKRHHTPLTII